MNLQAKELIIYFKCGWNVLRTSPTALSASRQYRSQEREQKTNGWNEKPMTESEALASVVVTVWGQESQLAEDLGPLHFLRRASSPRLQAARALRLSVRRRGDTRGRNDCWRGGCGWWGDFNACLSHLEFQFLAKQGVLQGSMFAQQLVKWFGSSGGSTPYDRAWI